MWNDGDAGGSGLGLPFLQILDACYPALGVCDHLAEEKGEACPAELCIATSV
jgi:hypothetical protein